MISRVTTEAASAYWHAWAPLPVRFSSRDARKLPEHWIGFGQRASRITGGPRTATNPANAILNYLYSLLGAEAIFACHGVGLDPGLGIFHRTAPVPAPRWRSISWKPPGQP